MDGLEFRQRKRVKFIPHIGEHGTRGGALLPELPGEQHGEASAEAELGHHKLRGAVEALSKLVAVEKDVGFFGFAAGSGPVVLLKIG